jgi:hypothetical protein
MAVSTALLPDARILAVPIATPVTRPDPETVATAEFVVDHVMPTEGITAPFASYAVAWSCWLDPGSSSTSSGETDKPLFGVDGPLGESSELHAAKARQSGRNAPARNAWRMAGIVVMSGRIHRGNASCYPQ